MVRMNSPSAQMEGRTVLVTGAGGFIGSTVVDFLLSCSARVRALLGAPGEAVRNTCSGAETYLTDIRDLAKVSGHVRGADVVVHLAGPPSVRMSFKSPSEYAAIHTLGTATILEACQREHVPRIVYLSSAEIYGRPIANPVSEDFEICPVSPYGAAKAGAEVFVRTIAAASGMKAVILRPFSVYGPRLSSTSLIANILQQLRNSDSVWVRDLKPVRDYCFARDVVEAIALACGVEVDGCTLNLGSGVGTSVKEVAECLIRLSGKKLAVRDSPISESRRSEEIYELVADTRRASAVLGWRARTSLEDGLRETILWMNHSGDS
jgi:nucleoside-diphosphate-sugar epimerase